jgi:hypothetical protein
MEEGEKDWEEMRGKNDDKDEGEEIVRVMTLKLCYTDDSSEGETG